MIRGLSIIAVAATGVSASAFAEPATPVDASANAAQKAELAAVSGAMEARQHLVRQGYVNVSELNKNEQGLWTGTAVKDGKTIFIAIDLRKPNNVQTKTN